MAHDASGFEMQECGTACATAVINRCGHLRITAGNIEAKPEARRSLETGRIFLGQRRRAVADDQLPALEL